MDAGQAVNNIFVERYRALEIRRRYRGVDDDVTEYFVFSMTSARTNSVLDNRTAADVYATTSRGGVRIADKFRRTGLRLQLRVCLKLD
jgi:hypothetical protein